MYLKRFYSYLGKNMPYQMTLSFVRAILSALYNIWVATDVYVMYVRGRWSAETDRRFPLSKHKEAKKVTFTRLIGKENLPIFYNYHKEVRKLKYVLLFHVLIITKLHHTIQF